MAAKTIQSNMYERTFTSFGGPDIVPIFNNKVIGECQAITYSIRREKAPVYTFGSADPRSYARGKRGIAGSVVFVQFDRHALLEEMSGVRQGEAGDGVDKTRRFSTVGEDGGAAFGPADEVAYEDQGIVLPAAARVDGILGVSTWGNDMSAAIGKTGAMADFRTLLGASYTRVKPWYSDQLPAFHITITMANEQGQAASMRILYAEILNEGVGMSVDDTVIEQAMTFVARRIIPLRSIDNTAITPVSTAS